LRKHRRSFEGLRDEVVASGAKERRQLVLEGGRRKRYDRATVVAVRSTRAYVAIENPRPTLLRTNAARRFESVHNGHPHVHEDQVRAPRPPRGDGVSAVDLLADIEADRLE